MSTIAVILAFEIKVTGVPRNVSSKVSRWKLDLLTETVDAEASSVCSRRVV